VLGAARAVRRRPITGDLLPINREGDLVAGLDDVHDLSVSVKASPDRGARPKPPWKSNRRSRGETLLSVAVVVNFRTNTNDLAHDVDLDPRANIAEREVEGDRRL
jgi:hypothetical protein